MNIDRSDQQILEILQVDGRIANQDLADRIGLSPSPCLRRVRALEESGLILGYRAMLDAKKLGLSLIALVHISMDRHTPERFANFEASVAVLPEVLECLLITGQDADYQIKVAVKDMDHYQALLLNKLTRIEEVRVGGQTQSIDVQPKNGAPGYEITPLPAGADLTETQNKGSTGKSRWRILNF